MGFFDKLKIGGEKESKEEKKIKKAAESTAAKRGRPSEKVADKIKAKKPTPEPKEERKEINIVEPKGESDFEGELALDVYETDKDFVIQSTIAGIKSEDLDVTIENDIVTIKGSRTKQVSEEAKKYYYQECYWGAFSRQIILPEEVDGSKAEASIKDGVFTLRIPKVIKIQKRKIAIRQES